MKLICMSICRNYCDPVYGAIISNLVVCALINFV